MKTLRELGFQLLDPLCFPHQAQVSWTQECVFTPSLSLTVTEHRFSSCLVSDPHTKSSTTLSIIQGASSNKQWPCFLNNRAGKQIKLVRSVPPLHCKAGYINLKWRNTFQHILLQKKKHLKNHLFLENWEPESPQCMQPLSYPHKEARAQSAE